MNIKKIEQLVNVFKKSNLKEINFHDPDIKISLAKENIAIPQSIINKNEGKVETNGEKYQLVDKKVMEYTSNSVEIKSECVGTFHQKIDSETIESKKIIDSGAEIFSIKAMKIEKPKIIDVNCKVVKYLVNTGDIVEYGQPVVVVEKAG
jgi:acetyl-CoA carboxylase biotin carboxyl carrier protein